jgi:hypothetical protein
MDLISFDETISAWSPRKTALGSLSNISFIAQKPELLCKIKIKEAFLNLLRKSLDIKLLCLCCLKKGLNLKQQLALQQVYKDIRKSNTVKKGWKQGSLMVQLELLQAVPYGSFLVYRVPFLLKIKRWYYRRCLVWQCKSSK